MKHNWAQRVIRCYDVDGFIKKERGYENRDSLFPCFLLDDGRSV